MNFLYVNIAFVIYIAGVFYYSQVANIKANWPQYRCNPMYMFLATDVEQNFTYCIQTMQSNYMGYILQPLTFVTNSLTSMAGGFTADIQNIRAMFDKVRTFFSSIIESVFGVFLNLIIEFQKITIGIRDLMGKTIGIMVSLMYIMDGSVQTMNSTWNGPPGQLVQALGKCFSPSTHVVLKNGSIKEMQHIDLGDVLEDGSRVEAVMKIKNTDQLPFYSIPLHQTNQTHQSNQTILVTGTHLVFDSELNRFVQVHEYSNAVLTPIIDKWFSCLITDTHKIPIGGKVFWDWEDHFVKSHTFSVCRN